MTEADPIRIGRLDGLEVTLASPTVSREHARIRREGERWVLEDSGSVNGVVIGGRRVRQQALAPGDEIVIEDFRLKFEPSDEEFIAGLSSKAQSFIKKAEKAGVTDPNLTFLNVRKLLDGD